MKTIEQENVQSTPSSLSSLGKLRISDTDTFFDDYSFASSFNMNRNSNSVFTSNKLDPIVSESGSSKSSGDQWVIVDDTPTEKRTEKPKKVGYSSSKAPVSVDSSSDAAQRKFGSAKAISSDQFFNDNRNDHETQVNLNRFQGSSSISSSEFFGNGRGSAIMRK